MTRLLLSVAFLTLFHVSANALTCSECMSACPHNTRDIKACDRGCPGICSKDEVAQIRKAMQFQIKVKNCKACMNDCPHMTRDFKPCDGGCVETCDLDSMRILYLEAKSDAEKCAPAKSAPGKKSENSAGTF